MIATKIEDLPTVYDAKDTEESIYKFWEDGEYFKADANSQKPPYSIVIPPPNVTGVLHMGHALDETLQDILVRYHRMAGYETLWVPGTDHAGLATQNVVERQLAKEGLTRYDLGREKFVERTWEWTNEHKSAILDQCKRLGASFDRSRERFTFDKGCSDAVKEVFVRLYEKGLIYKGKYIVNWCPRCNSAISDVETEYATEQGHMWEISYPLKDESGAIIVATQDRKQFLVMSQLRFIRMTINILNWSEKLLLFHFQVEKFLLLQMNMLIKTLEQAQLKLLLHTILTILKLVNVTI